jgi:hypothetical protein
MNNYFTVKQIEEQHGIDGRKILKVVNNMPNYLDKIEKRPYKGQTGYRYWIAESEIPKLMFLKKKEKK